MNIEVIADYAWEAMAVSGGHTPLKELRRKFGFEPARMTAIAKELLGRG